MKFINQYKGLGKEIYVLFVCKLIDNLGSMIGPMLTLILSSKLGMKATEIAIFSTIFMIISLPVQLLGGKICDKFNKKLVLNIGDISTSILYIVCGLMGISKTTIIIYYLGSLIQQVESPVYESLVADFSIGEKREKAYSLLYLGLNLGMMLAPTIGGFLLNDYAELIFIFNGIFQLISIVIFDIFIKNTTAQIDSENKYEEKVDDLSTFTILKQNKVIFYFIIIFSFSIFAYNMWSFLMPLTLNSIQGELGSIYYGTMSTMNCIVVVLFTAPITSFIIRMIAIDKMILGNALELIGFVIFVMFVNVPFMYYIAIVLFTFGEIINTITTSPYLTKRIPINYRGRIYAACNFFNAIVIAIGQYVIGIVYDNYNMIVSWSIVFVIYIITILIYQLLKKEDRKAYPDLYEKENLM